jgi:hypothetical protein
VLRPLAEGLNSPSLSPIDTVFFTLALYNASCDPRTAQLMAAILAVGDGHVVLQALLATVTRLLAMLDADEAVLMRSTRRIRQQPPCITDGLTLTGTCRVVSYRIVSCRRTVSCRDDVSCVLVSLSVVWVLCNSCHVCHMVV